MPETSAAAPQPGAPQEARQDFSKDPRFADQQLPQTMLLPLRGFTFLRLSPEMISPAYQVSFGLTGCKGKNQGTCNVGPRRMSLKAL